MDGLKRSLILLYQSVLLRLVRIV